MGSAPSPPLPPAAGNSQAPPPQEPTATSGTSQTHSQQMPAQYYQQHTQHPKIPNTSRSRTASHLNGAHQPQPIKDAVNTAFDQSPSVNQLDPDFMKKLTEQVTEQVIRNLQAANLGGPTPSSSVHSQQSQQAPPSTYSGSDSPTPRSPLQNSTDSFPPRFTPPSPRFSRNAREPHYSPPRAVSDDGSECSGSERSRGSTQSCKETTPRPPQPEVVGGLRRSKTTAVDGTLPLTTEATARRREASGSPKSSRKDSKDAQSGYFDSTTRRRSVPAPVSEDTDEATTLEKIWQPLFDNGNPTMRLSQFLRGLAKHIIEDYEPKGNLVIPPQKLLRFLEETKVEQEHYPWSIILGGKMSWNSISMMYRKLLCQHHFIQQQVHDVPVIPALTPMGFEQFMTCLIQAHPDTEFERLAQAVKEMPISNADDSKERFPKELSRRLLPNTPNVQAEQRLISSLNHEPALIQLERGASAMPPPPPPPASAPPQQNSFQERERAPYSQISQSSNAVDDEDLSPPSMPIERERKPYFAKEGSGKRYEGEGDRERDFERDSAQSSREPSRPAANKYRPDYSGNVPPRSNTQMPPQGMYSRSGSTDPVNIPPPNRRNRMSTGPPPLQTGSYGKSGRRNSPPSARGFARSDPMDIGNIPQSQYASNLHSGTPRDRFSSDADEDGMRYNQARRPPDRNLNYMNDDEMMNGRPIPPRSGPPAPGYDPNAPPNNYGPRGNAGAGAQGRSFYSAAPNAGTDGYGSYAPNNYQPGQY